MTDSQSRRRARIFRAPSHIAAGCVPYGIDGAEVGDLVEQHAGGAAWWVCTHTHPVTWKTLRRTPGDDYVVDNITRRFTDALAHYYDACCVQQDTAARLFIRVDPWDAGFRAAFVHRDADWYLCRQWTSVLLDVHGGEWWICDIDYGLGQISSSFAFHRNRARFAALVSGNFTSRVGLTQDISAAVATYRALIEPATTSYLVLHVPLLDLTNPQLWWQRLERCLASIQVFLGGWKPGHSTDGPYRTLQYYAIHRPARRSRAAVAEAIGAMCEREYRSANRLLAVVDEDARHVLANWPPSVDPAAFTCQVLESYLCEPLLGGPWYAQPEFRWRTVHRFVLGAALALAPLCLPPYVLLEILEWLPEMRHHIHSLVVGLLVGVRDAVRRVQTVRPNE